MSEVRFEPTPPSGIVTSKSSKSMMNQNITF